jgi:cytochrome c peroxidase
LLVGLLTLVVQLPAGSAQDALVARGRALFSDTKLSGDGKYSCATCHPSEGHTDNKTYVGVEVVKDGDPKGRSTPTLWGAGSRQAYSWAGTAPSLAGNIRGIIVNRMKGREPSAETLDALVAYVRSLDYPANLYLKLDGSPNDAAPAAAKRGFEIFTVKAGCKACHQPSLAPPLTSTNGRFATLDEAVRFMWQYVQKAGTTEKLTDEDLQDLVEFLKIL